MAGPFEWQQGGSGDRAGECNAVSKGENWVTRVGTLISGSRPCQDSLPVRRAWFNKLISVMLETLWGWFSATTCATMPPQ
jgi:hypothetical protein